LIRLVQSFSTLVELEHHQSFDFVEEVLQLPYVRDRPLPPQGLLTTSSQTSAPQGQRSLSRPLWSRHRNGRRACWPLSCLSSLSCRAWLLACGLATCLSSHGTSSLCRPGSRCTQPLCAPPSRRRSANHQVVGAADSSPGVIGAGALFFTGVFRNACASSLAPPGARLSENHRPTEASEMGRSRSPYFASRLSLILQP
jgi:hypothetical protein